MPENGGAPPPQPVAETAAAAVALLQGQLKMVTDTFDSLDRKASLLPPFLGAAVGLLIVGSPVVKYSTVQTLLIGAGLAVAIGAGFCAIQSLITRSVNMGPNSNEVADSITRPLVEVNRATADALAQAVRDRLKVNRTKGNWFNAGVSLTGLAMLLIVLSRVVGGL